VYAYGERHPFWQDVLKNQEASPCRNCFHIQGFPVGKVREDGSLGYDTFAFSPRMPKWNTEDPTARRYLIEAALYWIRECDIDAWRLDVANEVSFDFWQDFCREVRREKQDFYVLGEVWYDASRWINRPGLFDAVMNYPLGSAVSEFLVRGRTGAGEFTGKLFDALLRYGDAHNRVMLNLLDSHDTARLLHQAGGDLKRLRNAFIMLFLLPGAPCLYYGTEAGMTGGPDPDCRRPMLWDPARRDAELETFFRELISLRRAFAGPINEGLIHYEEKDFPLWRIGGDALRLVYTGERPRSRALLEESCGEFLLGAAPAAEYIPPETLAVFRGSPAEIRGSSNF
jgi:glycosidase